MRRQKQRSGLKILKSRCGDLTVRKSSHDIARTYEALGFESEVIKNYAEAHNYFQHAEHYIRLNNGDDF
jgi:hypothetical protein